MRKGDPLIKSVVTAFPYAVEVGAPLLEPRRMMLEHHVHHLPVTSAHRLCGIITDRDLKLLLAPEFDYPDPRTLTVEDAYIAEGSSRIQTLRRKPGSARPQKHAANATTRPPRR